jgi:hypothetical protein
MKLVAVLVVAGCGGSTSTYVPATSPPKPKPPVVETPENAKDTASELSHRETAPTPNAGPGELQAGQIEQAKLGDQHAAEVARIQPPEPPPPPPEAQHLLVATSAIAIAPPESTRLAGALERLADALTLVAPSRTDDIARIRESAEQIEIAGADDGSHAPAVRAALVAAGDALRAIPLDLSTSYGVRLRNAADEVVQKATSINPGAPLKDQYTPVRQALRASTDAVYSALHEPPPVLPGQA